MKTALWFLSLLCAFSSLFGQSRKVIFRGKITMEDGSAPGKSVGTQRVCSDRNGSGPGPLTDKQGVFTWTLDIDFMGTRRCFIEGTLNGYESSQADISNVNPSVGINVDLPPIKLTLKGGNPHQLGGAEKDVPSKGAKEWGTAMKAVQAGDRAGAIAALQAATTENPKFALAWHNLGILLESQRSDADALGAYAKAIDANPKMLLPYVASARMMVNAKDWAGVLKMSDAVIAIDKDRIFPEMFVHKAVAHYSQKDLAAAEADATEALNPKAKRTSARAEYVLGRILEAKGDTAAAKQHMTRYLELVPSADDAVAIKAHIEGIGKPGASEPELEVIVF